MGTSNVVSPGTVLGGETQRHSLDVSPLEDLSSVIIRVTPEIYDPSSPLPVQPKSWTLSARHRAILS